MKTALVLIDIQNDYFPGGRMELVESLEASHRAQEVLAAFRNNGDDIVHIQHLSTRPNATFFLPNTPGAEIHAQVSPLPGETVLVKHFPNSFRGTGLHETLAARQIERIVFVGMMTHMCIDTTVRAAFDLGYKCVLLGDGCATKDLTYQSRTIPANDVNFAYFSAINGMFADVKTSREFLSESSNEPRLTDAK